MKSSDYEIAGYDDIRELYDLQLLAFESEAEMTGSRSIPALMESFEENRRDFSNWTVLIRRNEDGRIIGAVRYREEGDHIEIGRVMVAPEYRRWGIASGLMTAIEERTKADTFELYTCTRSYLNIRLYEKLGYKTYRIVQGERDLSFAYMRKENDPLKYKIRKSEDDLIALFSERRPFSEHLDKWEDELLPDKYDQNFFEYRGQPTKEEFAKAAEYQKKKRAGFIKLEGDEPLSDSFGLEESVTLTMILRSDAADWTINTDLVFSTPSLKEAEAIDVKHFGPLYGEDFSKRNIRRQYEKLTYHGAYLDGKLAGMCYSFTSDGLTCIDGLIVDKAYRRQYVATSLIAYIKGRFPDSILYLHADEDDSPKEMYEKMGFEMIDKRYEYICLDI